MIIPYTIVFYIRRFYYYSTLSRINYHNVNKDFRAHCISSLQVDSLKKGFDGFDKEGGIINQTSMVMILKSMGVDVTKVQCWSKQKIIISSFMHCNCSLTWRTTQLRWTRRTPANSTSPCFVRLCKYLIN